MMSIAALPALKGRMPSKGGASFMLAYALSTKPLHAALSDLTSFSAAGRLL
jgi:hypothetical protein